MKTACLVLLWLIIGLNIAEAQFILTPIKKRSPAYTLANARLNDTSPLSLPFWEDFSSYEGSPNPALWLDSGVWINTDMGINPPSIGVATFDGINKNGVPYNTNNALAKGIADKLYSRPIDLEVVPNNLRNTVYLSFYYECKGNGEVPDPSDALSVDFLGSDNQWQTAWRIEQNGSLPNDAFSYVILPITEDIYFHKNFQFRFRNFSRLSGPFDAWHIDYVYVNKNRNATQRHTPDRALASTLSPLFAPYRSVPLAHLKKHPNFIAHPYFYTYNLQENNIQPLNYTSESTITAYKQGIAQENVQTLENNFDMGTVATDQRKQTTLNTGPAHSTYDFSADSLQQELRLYLATKDNITIGNSGDYDENIYQPIDFRLNDTLRYRVKIKNYYAYDDGTAEYGASLGQSGAQVACLFEIPIPTDTIAAVQIHFPRFSDNTNQIIIIKIWDDENGFPKNVLYQETVTVQRTEKSKFVTYEFRKSVPVKSRFYIGWQQNSASGIAIGLDKSFDNADKVFFNTEGAWQQNVTVSGSLMIRPVLGANGFVLGIPEQIAPQAYPNPSSGIIYLPHKATALEIFDVIGHPILFNTIENGEKTVIQLLQTSVGFFVLSYVYQGRLHREKIVIAR